MNTQTRKTNTNKHIEHCASDSSAQQRARCERPNKHVMFTRSIVVLWQTSLWQTSPVSDSVLELFAYSIFDYAQQKLFYNHL